MNLTSIAVDLSNRVRLFQYVIGLTGGGATKLDGIPTRAFGVITFSSNPTALDTITLNGTVWTFVAASPTGNQTLIGANLAATLTQLGTDLNASVAAEVFLCTYTVDATHLFIKYDDGDFAANLFNIEASAAVQTTPHLIGGMDAGTAGTTGGVFCALVIGGVLSFYRLVESAAAESSPAIIRPDDWTATVHERVWELVGVAGAVIGSYLPTAGGVLTGPLVATLITLDKIINTQSTLTYAGTTNLDLDGISARTLTLTGNVTFTTSNRGVGKMLKIKILCDATPRTFTFPAWIFLGAAAPAGIAAGKTAILSLECFGPNDTDVLAAYAVQP